MLNLYNADFFEASKDVADGTVAMIFADIPYNVTLAKWDKTIWDLQAMWAVFNRVLKPNGVVIMTATEPFNVNLINSNRKHFRYSWVWEKSLSSGFLNAKKMPLKSHELVLVWYKALPTYNPALEKSETASVKSGYTVSSLYATARDQSREQLLAARTIPQDCRYPRSVLRIACVSNAIAKKENRKRHPTEKPVELVEYMIKTYTNPGELVLDPCMGTGATMLAANNLGRDGVGFELEKDYFDTTKQRLDIFGHMCYNSINGEGNDVWLDTTSPVQGESRHENESQTLQ